ncbi:MAG: amino acid/amide transporter rane protein 2, family [Frankiales bacterium]|jgi:branched-chain amino acid transport system permease protein|nr:amino acid/amide transporter rane protein 2, family [Frankiales bacterium]
MSVYAPPAEDAAVAPAGRHRVGRSFGPIRWLPRILVLLPFVYWFLYRIPSNEAAAPIAADACIYAIVGLSLNILIGYTGQLSLGHNGFFGIGAFAAAYSLTVRDVPFAATFVVAALCGALFALFMGVVALRITGLYLALITLVFGLTLEESLFEVKFLTNAGAGQPADRPEFLFDDRNFFYFCLCFLLVALYIDYRLLKSKAGRALLALKENERVAEAFGINVTAFKLLAFVLSGTLAGVAGALLAYRIGIVTASGLGFNLALTFVLMTVVGGLGSRLGVVLGASLFASLGFLLESTWVHSVQSFLINVLSFGNETAKTNVESAIVGFIGALGLLLTIVLNPGGIAQQISPITRWLSGKPFSLHGDKEAGPASVEGSSVRA